MVGAFLLGAVTASAIITLVSYFVTIGKDDEE